MANQKASTFSNSQLSEPGNLTNEEQSSHQCVRSCMSSPVKTVQADASLADAQAILLRYGHTCLCVIGQQDQLVGMLSRRDVDVALRHGRQAAQVLTCMSTPVRSITPQTSLAEAHELMVTYDIGRLPVMASSQLPNQASNCLVGIITRSDLFRQLRCFHPFFGADTGAETALTETTLRPSQPKPSQLFQQLKVHSGSLWPLIESLMKIAAEKGWELYVVGGAVRDLLLNHMGRSHPLTDIDLVVDGAQTGAGAMLASSVQSIYPQFDLKVYGEFQTATLTLSQESGGIQGKSVSRSSASDTMKGAKGAANAISDQSALEQSALEIDIATARTEYYPYPAANPEVEASTIHQDLYRRDFTINAMALCLTGADSGAECGQLIDFFGGWLNLQQRHIRVIHPNSFIEDPTRIFRAIRFATRLGFELDPYTQRLVGYAVHTPLYAQVKAQHQKVPALQSRLTSELEKSLSADHWLQVLEQLSQLGALRCLHADLLPSDQMTQALRLQLCRIARWQRKFLPDTPRWCLLLVLLLAQLLPSEGVSVAKTLNLDAQSRYQLANLHRWERELATQLPNANKPSEIYQCLNSYSQVEQLLIVARNPYTLGPQIWHHIIHLSRMSPLINGGTLKRLGYPPGPKYREILTAVHQLTLDGVLDSASVAESYVITHYPLEKLSKKNEL